MKDWWVYTRHGFRLHLGSFKFRNCAWLSLLYITETNGIVPQKCKHYPSGTSCRLNETLSWFKGKPRFGQNVVVVGCLLGIMASNRDCSVLFLSLYLSYILSYCTQHESCMHLTLWHDVLWIVTITNITNLKPYSKNTTVLFFTST